MERQRPKRMFHRIERRAPLTGEVSRLPRLPSSTLADIDCIEASSRSIRSRITFETRFAISSASSNAFRATPERSCRRAAQARISKNSMRPYPVKHFITRALITSHSASVSTNDSQFRAVTDDCLNVYPSIPRGPGTPCPSLVAANRIAVTPLCSFSQAFLAIMKTKGP